MDLIFNKEVDIIECDNSKIAHENGLYKANNEINEEIDIAKYEEKHNEIDFIECEQINEDTLYQDNNEPTLLCS